MKIAVIIRSLFINISVPRKKKIFQRNDRRYNYKELYIFLIYLLSLFLFKKVKGEKEDDENCNIFL